MADGVRVESNSDEVSRTIEKIVDSFVFTRRGVDQSLGRDLSRVAAQGIIDRTVADQQDTNRAALKPNAPRYAAYKAKRYRMYQPLLRTGQMMSLESVLGEVRVSDHAIEMTYGVNRAPTRSATGQPSPLPRADLDVTDREKGEFVTAGGRSFYGLDEEIADEMIAECERVLDDILKRG